MPPSRNSGQQLQQPDLAGQGRPAAGQPVLAAEHSGLGHRREEQEALRLPVVWFQPDMFSRGFSYIFFSQQAIATDQAKVFAEWRWGTASRAARKPPPTRRSMIRSAAPSSMVPRRSCPLPASGRSTRTSDPATTKNFDSVVNAMRGCRRRNSWGTGRAIRGWVNLIRSLNRANYQLSILYQSSSPTYGQQYLDAVGPENAEGVFFSSSYSPLSDTPDNAEFVKPLPGEVRGRAPRGCRRRVRPPARCSRPSGGPGGAIGWRQAAPGRLACAATASTPCWARSKLERGRQPQAVTSWPARRQSGVSRSRAH